MDKAENLASDVYEKASRLRPTCTTLRATRLPKRQTTSEATSANPRRAAALIEPVVRPPVEQVASPAVCTPTYPAHLKT